MNEYSIHAEFAAEMVSQAIAAQYPEEVYTRGFRVYTTLRKADQEAAYASLRKGVLEYDRQHGYRNPEGFVELPANVGDDDFDELLADHADSDDLLAAIVLAADAKHVQVPPHRREIDIRARACASRRAAWTQDDAAEAHSPRRDRAPAARGQELAVVQLPEVESAHRHGSAGRRGARPGRRLRLQPQQVQPRHPGLAPAGSSSSRSSIPLRSRRASTAATVIPDEPVVLEAEETGSQRWEPKNYDGRFRGRCDCEPRSPSRRTWSRSACSRRSARSTPGVRDALRLQRRHPPYLTMALGAGSVTAWQMARAYAVFANGGFLVQPYFIHKIVDDRGNRSRSRSPSAPATRRCASSTRAMRL